MLIHCLVTYGRVLAIFLLLKARCCEFKLRHILKAYYKCSEKVAAKSLLGREMFKNPASGLCELSNGVEKDVNGLPYPSLPLSLASGEAANIIRFWGDLTYIAHTYIM